MPAQTLLAELRRKKQCIELAIRALERLQQLKQGRPAFDWPASLRNGTAKVVVLQPIPHPRS